MLGFVLALVVAGVAAAFLALCFAVQTVPHTLRVRYYVSRSWRKGQRVHYVQFGTRSGPFAMGAGYIGGATAYLGFNCIKPTGDSLSLYKTVPFCIGITCGGNSVPYVQG